MIRGNSIARRRRFAVGAHIARLAAAAAAASYWALRGGMSLDLCVCKYMLLLYRFSNT